MSRQIRTLIVDDEPLAREGMRLSLDGDDEIAIIGECTNGPEAVEAIGRLHPDLVFLDIQIPGMDGLDVLRRLPAERLPMVVFVTAFDHYAVRAFDAHALDYLLKPVDGARFQETLTRIKEHFRAQTMQELTKRLVAVLKDSEVPQHELRSETEYLRRITIKSPDRVYFVPVDEIDWIEAADYYVNLHTGSGAHLLRMTLSALEGKLDPSRFARIHRSTIINLSRIKELLPHFRGEYHVVLHNGIRLKLSRTYRSRLDQFLNGPN